MEETKPLPSFVKNIYSVIEKPDGSKITVYKFDHNHLGLILWENTRSTAKETIVEYYTVHAIKFNKKYKNSYDYFNLIDSHVKHYYSLEELPSIFNQIYNWRWPKKNGNNRQDS